MNLSEKQQGARTFINSYLAEIRHKASSIPQRDRGYFPNYWSHSYKISIVISTLNGIAINLERPHKKKFDSITFKTTPHRIEEAIFNNLNYSLPVFFRIGMRDVSVGHMTLVTDLHPYFKLEQGGDVRIKKVRFEQRNRVEEYPRQKDFLWMFSDPSNYTFSNERAKHLAIRDFWEHFEWLIFTKRASFLRSVLEDKTISLLRQSMEDLLQECIDLITREDLDEAMLQTFVESHYMLLNPKKTFSLKKRKVGGFIPDLVLEYEDKSVALVELQLNTDPLITNNVISPGLQEAIGQVKDWFEWVDKNEPSRLIDKHAIILIGRRESYLLNKDRVDRLISGIGFDTKFLTYDDLVDGIKGLISELEK